MMIINSIKNIKKKNVQVKKKFLSLLLILIFCVYCIQNASSSSSITIMDNNNQCEPITLDLCSNVGYNFTSYPNMFKHENQAEAGFILLDFVQLIQSQCSSQLPLLLCSIFVPICLSNNKESESEELQKSSEDPRLHHPLIPACRSVCEQARTGCEPLMNRFGFIWPLFLNCSTFPSNGLCMNSEVITTITKKTTNDYHQKNQSNIKNSKIKQSTLISTIADSSHLDHHHHDQEDRNLSKFFKFPYSGNIFYSNKKESASTIRNNLLDYFSNETTIFCSLTCNILNYDASYSVFFSSLLSLFQYSLIIFSVSNFVLTLFTLITYLLTNNNNKYQNDDPKDVSPSFSSKSTHLNDVYPERALIFMILCHLIMTIGGYILPSLSNSFDNEKFNICVFMSKNGNSPMQSWSDSSYNHNGCLENLIVRYYFGLVFNCWWLVWCGSWFATTRLQWVPEVISSFTTTYSISTYYHLFSWIVPFLFSIFGLLLFTNNNNNSQFINDRYCSIVDNLNIDLTNLLSLLLLPEIVFLIVCTYLCTVSISSLKSIYERISSSSSSSIKSFKKLLRKFFFFSIFFILNKLGIVICFIWQYFYLSKLEQNQEYFECNNKEKEYKTFVSGTTLFLLSIIIRRHLILLISIVPCLYICFNHKSIDYWGKNVWSRLILYHILFKKIKFFSSTKKRIQDDHFSPVISRNCQYASLMPLSNAYQDMEDLELVTVVVELEHLEKKDEESIPRKKNIFKESSV